MKTIEQPLFGNLSVLYEGQLVPWWFEILAEASKKRPSGKNRKGWQEHIDRLNEFIHGQLHQMAGLKYGDQIPGSERYSADDVYEAIMKTWGEEFRNDWISPENWKEFKETMDGIRQSWIETPDPQYHRFGPHTYRTEKEELAGYPVQWILKQTVGGASVGDRRPSFGSSKWINAPDSGGAATSGRPAKGSGQPGHAPGAYENPHVSASTGKATKPPTESKENLAIYISEDVNETWRIISENDDMTTTDGPAVSQTDGGPQQQVVHQAFTKADQAAGIVKEQLESLIKAKALTPDMKKKFAEFGQYLVKVAQH